jgi:hypothetical protein
VGIWVVGRSGTLETEQGRNCRLKGRKVEELVMKMGTENAMIFSGGRGQDFL